MSYIDVINHNAIEGDAMTEIESIVSKLMNPEPPTSIQHRAILFNLAQTFSPGMSELALYEATRGVWKLTIGRASNADYAMAVFDGIIREVYNIRTWHDAGDIPYQTRDISEYVGVGRIEFSGEVATDIRGIYLGKYVGKLYCPAKYVNI